MAARLGGDEFVIILEGIKSLREAEVILGRMVQSLQIKVENNAVCVNIFTSIGATIYPLDFSDTDSLLIHADEAMYQAKRAGGNRFVIAAS